MSQISAVLDALHKVHTSTSRVVQAHLQATSRRQSKPDTQAAFKLPILPLWCRHGFRDSELDSTDLDPNRICEDWIDSANRFRDPGASCQKSRLRQLDRSGSVWEFLGFQ